MLEYYKFLGEDLCNELLEFIRSNNKKVKNDVPNLAAAVTAGFKVVNPVTGGESDLYDTIIHLNDEAKWSREQIADWIDTLPDQPKWRLLNDVQEQEPKIRF